MNREQGTTIFLTSHDAGDVEHVCRRAIVIDRGRVILDQPVKKLKYDYLNRKIIAVRYLFLYFLISGGRSIREGR